VKSNISEQTNYLQSKFTIIHPQNYKMSPLRGVTLAGLAKKYPKNGGVRKVTVMDHSPINQNFDLNKSRQNSIIA
jgi:hypothetical protein